MKRDNLCPRNILMMQCHLYCHFTYTHCKDLFSVCKTTFVYVKINTAVDPTVSAIAAINVAAC